MKWFLRPRLRTRFFVIYGEATPLASWVVAIAFVVALIAWLL